MTVSSYDQRLYAVEVIDGIFGKGVLGDNQPQNINTDVLVLTNNLLNQLRVSNLKMDEFLATLFSAGIGQGLSVAFFSSKFIRALIRRVIEAKEPIPSPDVWAAAIEEAFLLGRNVIRDFFTVLRADRNYLIILNNLARTYKSPMAMALNGIY